MAAAPALGSPVTARSVLLTLLLGLGGEAGAAVQVLVVSGLGGDAQYDTQFAALGHDIAAASRTVTGEASRVQQLAGAQATAVAVERAIDQLAAQLLPGDQAIVVFIGHGSYDGAEYRLNLPGPDLTGTRLATLLDRLPATVPQLVVNATSASGAMLSRLQRPQRVVITATQSAGERNATRYASHWARALVSPEADRDKDEAVTAVEAFDYATRQVAEAFKADAAIATEHAQLRGADPARFVVARLGRRALYAGDAALQALRSQQVTLEEQLGAIKARKAALGEERYFTALEPVLREIARQDQRIEAREQQLAGDTGVVP